MSSHATPMSMQRAERYGGNLRRTGDRRRVKRRAAKGILVSESRDHAQNSARHSHSAMLVFVTAMVSPLERCCFWGS